MHDNRIFIILARVNHSLTLISCANVLQLTIRASKTTLDMCCEIVLCDCHVAANFSKDKKPLHPTCKRCSADMAFLGRVCGMALDLC